MFGGVAAERAISLESGTNVAGKLEEVGARVIRIDPAKQGWSELLDQESFVFNLLHGPGGEDGTVQGLLEAMNIPYSGSGVLGSALTMDKVRTKQLWQGAGFSTPDFSVLSAENDWKSVLKRHGQVFVKPALEGSSLGMSKATTPKELRSAFKAATVYGDAVFAERYVEGSEYTVAILGNQALPSIRIEVSDGFYDFDAKYKSKSTRFYCPSGLSIEDESDLAALALAAFRSVGGEIWGRVDLIRDFAGLWHLLEVNTIPGMTVHSLVPMAAEAAGISMIELLQKIYKYSMETKRCVR